MSLHVVVEGYTDEPVAKKITTLAGWDPESVFIQNAGGTPKLDPKIVAYNRAAQFSPQFILRDLDQDCRCAGEKRATLLPQTEQFMCFRLAVRSTEAWLMADPDALARYLHISVGQIALHPESVGHPKDEMVNLARSSPKSNIRKDMVPKPGESRRVGRGYEGRIVDYSINYWRPEIARQNCPSLHRSILALERLHHSWQQSTH